MSKWRPWLPLLLGGAMALLALEVFRNTVVFNVGQAAYGRNTAAYLTQGAQTQCADAGDSAKCIADWRKAGAPRPVLWFGNSMLAAINRMQPGDINAPELLRREMAARGHYLISYAQPNANLAEQAIIWQAIGPVYRPKLVILPICYDDIREMGIRPSVAAMADDPAVLAAVKARPYWPTISSALADAEKAANPQSENHRKTVQAKVEDAVNLWLEERSALWAARPNMRSTLGFAVHALRNQMLGIHSYSKRPVAGAVEADKLRILDDMLGQMRSGGTDVLIYVPPYRRDIDGPYVEAEYAAFKTRLAALARKHGARFADLEATVPGPEWATVVDDIFGFREPDFMHFTASGHQRLGRAVNAEAQAMGY